MNQESRLEKLLKNEDDEDGNKEFRVKQEVRLTVATPFLSDCYVLFRWRGGGGGGSGARLWNKANLEQRTAIEETRAVFPPLRQRISDALQKLEDQVEAGTASEEEVSKAKAAIQSAKEAASEK